MFVALLLASVGFLTLPAWTRPIGRRLHPAAWARLCLAAIVVGAVVAEVVALVFALPTVLRAAGVPELAGACERMLRPLTPGGTRAGWAAAAVAVTLPALAALGVHRARSTYRTVRAEPALGEHRPYRRYDWVLLPTVVPLAVSVPGEPGQIIVSQGLVEQLTPGELTAVLRHEAAHLDHAHRTYLEAAAAVDAAFGFWPFTRRSTATLRLALERWADEDAAGDDPARRRDLLDALVAVTHLILAGPVPASFSSADTVIERVAALQEPRRAAPLVQRAMLFVPGTALSAAVFMGLAMWLQDAHLVMAMAGRCPA